MHLEGIIIKAEQWLTNNGLQLAVVWLVTIIAVIATNVISKKLIVIYHKKSDHPEFQKRTRTLGMVFRYTVDIVVVSVAFIITLKKLGVDISPILTAAGLVGLAAGLGAQKLLQDIVSGFLILLEDQIRVGDVVDIDGKSGVVEKVSLRMTVLRDLTGSVFFIRNGNIGTVRNMTKDYSRYVFDIGVSYREDVDEVMEIIRGVDEELRADPEYSPLILEPIEMLGLDRFEDSAVVIKARTKTMPIEQWKVGREFNRRLKKAFDRRGIEIPFPHRTIYMGVNKEAPPVNVKSENSP